MTDKLTITGLSKRYSAFLALAPTDLAVAQGEFLSLLGPSGSGKTTLLSLIAGLSAADGGQLRINGVDVTHSAPYERDIGMVFQNYALFPHMTVEENICFPLKMRQQPAASARRQAAQALEMVRLPQLAQRYPRELSGGQQQRVALARCLVYRPSIILMDEPLGALDKKLRDQMQWEIKRIHRELGTTIVYVTHDQEEAMTMSDRICLMNSGKIEQLGSPSDLYFRPRTLFVADFLGESNLFAGQVEQVQGSVVRVELAHGGLRVEAGCSSALRVGSRVRVMVRPQNLCLQEDPVGPTVSATGASLRGQVLDSMITGSLTKVYVQTAADAPVVVSYPTAWPAQRHAPGQAVSLHWSAADAVAVPE
ncbi:ABC transporter ATP-binding protein [Verminephrobacter aporrectodeae subsp. tuberculatae]|uniref:ABC transporter ATP-binding protein n=1 Tax=Verminephrobacter aporrectodeae TaxID=1110389 RepID=UPI0022433DC7|nr:ABC transporter ATP-binding protein [Verminephrobacter aporrectodeae]MCW8199689.1 ABC transporter ATP-binding protein [Verminephrobacter aporrectodeae subsp. tuberculatae]